MDVQIISLTPELYEEIIQMIQRTIRVSQKSIYPPELIEKFCHKYDFERFKVKAQEIEYFIAQDRTTNNVVGIIGLKDNELRTFFVDPDCQGNGIGRLLYDKLEQVAKDRKITKLILYGSPLGEPAYLKFGFHKVKTEIKEFEGIKFADAYMEKSLA